MYVLRRTVHGTEVLLGTKLTGLGAGKVVAPGGKLEPGESAEAAALRELQEEVGSAMTIGPLREVGVNRYRFPSRPRWDQDSHVFCARLLEGAATPSSELAPFWSSVESVPFERMWSDAASWLPGVLSGGTCGGLYEFGEDLSTVQRSTLEPRFDE